jgi:hypothetical protein
MEDPLKPPENQNPLDSDEPLVDPLAGASERSIRNPPGFTDPLTERDEVFMDDLAKQLDQLEASIENASPKRPESEVAKKRKKPDSQEDTSITPLPATETWGTFDTSPPLPQEGSAHTPPPNPPLLKPPLKGGGSIRPRRSLPPKVHFPGRPIVGASSNLRYCPESLELIDKQKCESCEKYRHWPEGTNEEPRECWYDWQMEEPGDETDDDSDE